MMDAVKLSQTEYLIMQMLVNEPTGMYGLELVKQSKGKLKRGTVYVLLTRLEDRGYVKAKAIAPPDGAGGMPRRRYSPTGVGQRATEAYEMARDHFRGRAYGQA